MTPPAQDAAAPASPRAGADGHDAGKAAGGVDAPDAVFLIHGLGGTQGPGTQYAS